MVRVNGKVSDAYTKQGYKQCPAPVVTLTKHVYFKLSASWLHIFFVFVCELT